jgi:hypothetical protein
MLSAAQTIEKNRFLGGENRHMNQTMSETEIRRRRILLLAIAAALALATLAPVAVLAA